jgi:GNAT superfamily N-acetyltransferase
VPVDDHPISIIPATSADAGEILTVQRAAYVSEAILYDNPRFSALTETLDDVHAAVTAGQVLVARHQSGTRIVGAVRGEVVRDECQVGRLVVAPDQQRRGIGRALLAAVEARFTARRFVLFTGSRSAANLRLYERAGYLRTRVDQSLVYLEKTAAE